MKRTLAALLTAVVLAAAPTLAAAEEKAWPSENITAIITHGAGMAESAYSLPLYVDSVIRS